MDDGRTSSRPRSACQYIESRALFDPCSFWRRMHLNQRGSEQRYAMRVSQRINVFSQRRGMIVFATAAGSVCPILNIDRCDECAFAFAVKTAKPAENETFTSNASTTSFSGHAGMVPSMCYRLCRWHGSHRARKKRVGSITPSISR